MTDGPRVRFRSISLGILAVITVLLAGWAFIAHVRAEQAALPTTIQDLISQPKKYSGKLVRLSGRLNECFGWECSLCPENMTTGTADSKRCLPLSFRPLIPETGFGSVEQESVFRFASVVLQAKFDPTCWTGNCLDREVILYDANVVSVSKRRSSREGLWMQNPGGLIEVAKPLAAAVESAAYDAGFAEGPPTKVFRPQQGMQALIVCQSYRATDPAGWPGSVAGAVYASSKSDFYRCNRVRNINGRWVVQVAG